MTRKRSPAALIPPPVTVALLPLVARVALAAFAVSLALGAACSRHAPRPAPATEAQAAPALPAAPARPPNATTQSAARGTLAERLAGEARTRPEAGPRVEAVAAALRGAGVAVAPPTQVLARTIGARYCAATSTPAGLAVAVCEFGDDAEAERGLAYSRRTFDHLVPSRTLLRNHATVLTLSPGDARALAPDVGRASAAFAAL